MNRDISQLEALIEELLTYARLDRPQNELHLSEPDLPLWLSTHLADIQAVTPDKTVRIKTLAQGHYAALDMRLMERVLDNLLNNALRYCHSTVETSLLLSGNRATLIVEDDGPGIAPETANISLNLCSPRSQPGSLNRRLRAGAGNCPLYSTGNGRYG